MKKKYLIFLLNQRFSDPLQNKKKTVQQLAQAYRDAAPYLNIGWFFVVAILLFVWLGTYLDGIFSVKPYLTLAGALFGILLGFLNLYKIIALLKNKK